MTFYRPTCLLALALGAVAFANAKPPVKVVQLPDSVPSAVQQSKVVGTPAPSQPLFLAIGLEPSNPGALQAAADMVSDPRSPSFHHFMTPEQVAANFGASNSDVNNVVEFLKANGMKVTLVARNHMAILASCTVGQAQAAFGTVIKNLVGPDPTGKSLSYIANTTPVSVPATISGVVQCVSGLDNYERPRAGTTSTLSPSLERGLYNTAPSYGAGFTGAGCKIAYSNWDGFDIQNEKLFVAHFGLPVPAGGAGSNIHVVVVGSGNGTSGSAEGDLDMQMEVSAAPLADVYVYDNNSYNYLGVLTKEASDNLADIISESWGWSGSGSQYTSIHNEHLTMTMQGQTYCCASGDSGTSWVTSYGYPDVDPEVTSVGGTIATVDSSTGARVSEVSWNGSGGGWNTAVYGNPNFNVHPSWQAGNGVLQNINYRMVPDIGMHSYSGGGADYFYFQHGLSSVSGTSCASPWFASGLATVEQRLVANGQSRRLGRINDMLYGQNGRSDVWFDIVSGPGNGTLPNGHASVVTAGWDTVTGWGAPNFDGLYNSLATQAQTITPSAFTVVRGKLISGDLTSLASIDQNYLVVQTGVTINANDPPIQVVLNGNASQGTASNLEVDLTAHCINGSGQAIDAWNWTTNSYVQIDSRNSTSTDSTVKVSIPNPNQYIQSGTNAVQLRIRYFRVSGIVSIAWNSFIDQAIWKLTP